MAKLIEDIEQMMPQEEIIEKRMQDIVKDKVKGKTEKDYNEYLKKEEFPEKINKNKIWTRLILLLNNRSF